MNYRCPYAYRVNGKNAVLCRQLKDAPYCGHQYFCPNTQRWENTEGARKCPLAFAAPMAESLTAVSITENNDMTAEETTAKKKRKNAATALVLAENVAGAEPIEIKQ